MTLAIADLVDYTTFVPSGSRELAMDLSSQRISGPRVVAEWVARSWFQPRGGNPANRGRGVDLRRLENATLGPLELDQWRQALEAEARAVEYVSGCSVQIVLRNRTVAIAAELTLVDGGVYPLMVGMSEAAGVVLNFGGTGL